MRFFWKNYPFCHFLRNTKPSWNVCHKFSREIISPAFSLMELLIVISLLGVLAAISVPSMSKYFYTKHLTMSKEIFWQNILASREEAKMFGNTIKIIIPKDTNYFTTQVCHNNQCEDKKIISLATQVVFRHSAPEKLEINFLSPHGSLDANFNTPTTVNLFLSASLQTTFKFWPKSELIEIL